MTLREIAAEAGVSISTVSRVINQNTKSPVSKEVQDRIWEIAKRTNYVPRHSKKILPIHLTCLPQNSFIPLPVFCTSSGWSLRLFFSTLAKILNRRRFVTIIF